MLTFDIIKEKYRDKILEVAKRRGLDNIRIFGSVARGDQTEASDIDFLVKLLPGRDLMDIGGFHWEMEELLNKQIHIVLDASIHPKMKDNILSEAKPL